MKPITHMKTKHSQSSSFPEPAEPSNDRSAAPPSNTRHVLLAVTGMSPAILTETVWALSRETPSVIPDEVVVITTTTGSDVLKRELLTPRPEWNGCHVWETLRTAILGAGAPGDPRLQLASPRVIELPDTKGVKVQASDLRNRADNNAAADFILEEVRRHAENPDTRIIASIAGGRKTMGALLHACLSLLGRETDRLTHVLVGDPFDVCRGFFFPSQPVQELEAGKREQSVVVRASNALIELADIPFVPLRNLFARDHLKKPGTFAALVARCSEDVAVLARQHIRLQFQNDLPVISVNETRITLSPSQYVLIRHLAEMAKEGKPSIDGYESASQAIVETAKRIHAEHDVNNFSDWRYKIMPEKKGWDDVNERWVVRNLSDLKARLQDAGPDVAAIIPLLPVKGRYSLNNLPPDSIDLGTPYKPLRKAGNKTIPTGDKQPKSRP